MKRDLCLAPRTFHPRDVSENLDAMIRLFREHRVEVAVLFGSLATPDGEGGDLDLAVALRDGASEFPLYASLCRLFSADNIDLVPFDRMPFLVRKRALLGGRVLYERAPGLVQRMIERVLREVDDFNYSAETVERHLRARLRGGLSVAERRLDRERMTAYLSRLDVSVRRLERLGRGLQSVEDFLAAEDARDLAVHHLRIAFECVLDICRHFLAVKGVALQELDTTNLIELAGQRGLLAPAFARQIRGMAGMRNAIVHVYLELDYGAILEMVTTRLADFDEFGRQVLAYLEQDQGPAR